MTEARVLNFLTDCFDALNDFSSDVLDLADVGVGGVAVPEESDARYVGIVADFDAEGRDHHCCLPGCPECGGRRADIGRGEKVEDKRAGRAK